MTSVKVAWFSPMPPSRSGIAGYSAELVPALRQRGHAIDVFDDGVAHDFVWKQRREPYQLTVFQLGNAACHDFMWAYLFRYPGIVVLHDAQLHQARALYLTKRWLPRRRDYLAEFHANHPEAPPDVGELVAAGLGGNVFFHWPMVRLVIERARVTVVHNQRLADTLREQHAGAAIQAVEMGVPEPVADSSAAHAVRRSHGIPDTAVVLAAFGGITPEKRIGHIIRALSAIAARHPQLHLLLVGNPAGHYDAQEDARTWGIADRVHLAGFVADADLPAYLRAADICACLRWPTNRETSASWLRCLAAARATIITDLVHLADVPMLDPRGWRAVDVHHPSRDPVAVGIDLLDEEHSLQLALERLAADGGLRDQLGRTGRAWWTTRHRLEMMVDGYDRLLAGATETAIPRPALPAHLTDDGSATLHEIVQNLGVADRLGDVLEQR